MSEDGDGPIERFAPAFVGLLANRVSDLLVAQGGAYLSERGQPAPPRAMSTLLTLRAGPRSVTEIASTLGVSHPAVIKIMRDLARRGLVERARDPNDARRKPWRLTGSGETAASETERFIAVAQRAYRRLFEEIGVDLHAALVEMEAALRRTGFDARLREAAREAPVEPASDSTR